MGYNTRIAPSPTGDMHLGTARTAYFNWLAAKSTGGNFLLRIDDTDEARHDEAAVDVIYQSMKWLDLDYEKSFRQSERKDRYRHIAEAMIARGSAKRLSDGAIQFLARYPISHYKLHDFAIGVASIKEESFKKVEGLILVRKDGTPTYNFTSVVDDRDCFINLIIRGTDHIDNITKQAAIWEAINNAYGEPEIAFPSTAHVGLITQGGKKLSKRDKAASMLHYKELGYHPEAMLNFMLRMGWGPKKDDASTRMIPRARALTMFLKDGNLKPSPAAFDQAKLDHLNKLYKAAKV